MVTYGITRLVLGFSGFIEIDGDRYSRIVSAKRNVVGVVTIEEKLDFLLENFAELERETLFLGVDHMTFRPISWEKFRFDTQRVNRRIANLLASARSYMDHVKHEASQLDTAKLNADLIAARLSKEYEASLGYRVMEQLRNFALHRNFPIQALQYDTRAVEERPGNYVECRAIPSIRISELEGDAKFKKSVLEELREMGDDRVPVTPFVRQYVESICRVHEELRETISTDLSEWENEIETAISEARDRFDSKVLGLAVVKRGGDKQHLEKTEIFEDFMRYRGNLARKNQSYERLASRFVSGAVDSGH